MYCTLFVKATIRGVFSDIREEGERIGIIQSGTNQCNIKIELFIIIHRFDHQLNQAFT